jgi:hypothetical protein
VNGTLVVEVCFAISDRITFLMKVLRGLCHSKPL